MIVTLTLLAASGLQNLPSASRDTQHLYASCRAFERVLDGSTAIPDLSDANYCIGYIHGYTAGATGAADHPVICAAEATGGAIARTYTHFMDDNPKFFDESKEVGFFVSLAKNYPCPSAPTQH